MKRALETILFFSLFVFCFNPMCFPKDNSYGYSGQGQEQWQQALDTQKNIQKTTASPAVIPGYAQTNPLKDVQRSLAAGEVLESEHIPNPLSLPGSSAPGPADNEP